MRSEPNIVFDCGPSRCLVAAVAVIFALAEFSIFHSGLYLSIKLVFAATVVLYASGSLHGYFRQPYHRVLWHGAGHWRLFDTCDQEIEADLVDSVRVGSILVLNLKPFAAACFRAVLLPDNLDEGTHRQLRVRLARVRFDEGSEDAPA